MIIHLFASLKLLIYQNMQQLNANLMDEEIKKLQLMINF